MLHLTDLILTPERSTSDPADWYLPQGTRALLAQVAPTSLPVLCIDCYGAAFRRVAAAVHRNSGREELRVVDLRASAGTLPAGLPEGPRAARTTLALDGVEHLDRTGQDVLASQLAVAPYRVLSATDVELEVLRLRWRPDLFALVSTVTVRAPALARRGEQIATLARRRLAALCAELGREVPELTPAAAQALVLHPWDGDLAELDAVLVRTLLASGGAQVDATDLSWRPEPPDATSAVLVEHTAQGAHVPEAAPEPVASAAPAGGQHAEPAIRQPLPIASGPSPTLEALAVELAHQLKNPLVTIKTFVGSIESLCQDPHELGQFRALTDDAVTRMDEILEGLLSFARLGAATLERLDVLPLLRDALRATWRGFSSKQVTLDAPDGTTLVARADREHVRFALGALARHVAETIEPRGALAIAVEPQATLLFSYRESGAITHLRGAANAQDSSLPLALLLVRGALGRVGGDVEIALEGTAVSIRLRLSPP